MQQNQIRRIIFVCIIIMLTCFGLSAHNVLMIRQQVSASSTEKYYSGDWEYQLDENNKVIITGYTGSDTELTIDEIDGKEVSVIGSTVFSGNKIIEKVILGEGVQEIGNGAFYSCSNLQEIILSDSLTTIGGNVFCFCDSLKEIELPKNLQYIDTNVFSDFTSFQTISISADNPYFVKENGIFYDADMSTVIFTSKSEIPSEIVIPNTVVEVEEFAFANCEKLKNIQCQDGLKKLGQYAFQGCSDLQEILLPDSVEELGASVFASCYNLEEFKLPANLKVIESGVFSASGLISVVIPAEITKIQESAFCGMNNLQDIQVEQENEMYYSEAGMLFDKKGVLLAAAQSVTGEVLLPNYCTRIGKSVFELRQDITKIIMPDSVTEIGSYAFRGCTNLTKITISSCITKIEEEAFSGTFYYNNEKNWENGICYLGNYVLAIKKESEIARIKEGCILVADVACFNGQLEAILFPNCMQYIGKYAFCGNQKLKTVIGGKNIKEIGGDAFSSCRALESVYFQGDTVTIEEAAFGSCSALKNLVIDATHMEVNGDFLRFDYCIEKLVIPNVDPDIILWNYLGSIVILNPDCEELLQKGEEYFARLTDKDIYLNLSATKMEGIEANWLSNNQIYFQEQFHICRFFVDEFYIACEIVLDGSGIIPPVTSEENYALMPEGPVYYHVSWDINQDEIADSLPEAVYSDIEARAVYEILEETHTWRVKEDVLEGTCDEEEEVGYQCIVCGAEKIVTGHYFTEEWIVDAAVTCTNAGIQSYHCLRTGCQGRSQITSILPKGHVWDDGVVIKEAEVGKMGEIQYTCLTCGATQFSYIKALPSPVPTPIINVTESPVPSLSPTSMVTESPKISYSPELTSTIVPTEIPEKTIEPTLVPTKIPGETIEPASVPTKTPEETIEPTLVPTKTPEETIEPQVLPTMKPYSTILPSENIAEYGEDSENEDIRVLLKLKNKKKTQVLIQWSCDGKADGYEIYRSQKRKKGYRRIKKLNANKTKYIDREVIAGKTYYYKVYCIMGMDTAAEEAISSEIHSIRIPLLPAPQITLSKGINTENIKFVQITVKKYYGKRIEVYFRKKNEDYRKLSLRFNDIKKANGKFRIGYKNGGELLIVRVRTYSGKKNQTKYSKYSKEKQIRL